MKQPFKFKKKDIAIALHQKHGIANIDINDNQAVEDTIHTILLYLNIEGVLFVQDPFCYSDSKECKFTLSAGRFATKEDYFAAIKKFQEYIKNKSPYIGLETEHIKNEISKFIDVLKEKGSKIKISTIIGSDEEIAKAKANFPQNWLYITPSQYNYSSAIIDYFHRKGYEIESLDSKIVYIDDKTKQSILVYDE